MVVLFSFINSYCFMYVLKFLNWFWILKWVFFLYNDNDYEYELNVMCKDMKWLNVLLVFER